jgi:hypothetical protein
MFPVIATIIVLGIIAAVLAILWKLNTRAEKRSEEFLAQHPEAVKYTFYEKLNPPFNEMFHVSSVDGASPHEFQSFVIDEANPVNSQTVHGFYVLPGQHVVKVQFTQTRPSNMQLEVEIIANRTYTLVAEPGMSYIIARQDTEAIIYPDVPTPPNTYMGPR